MNQRLLNFIYILAGILTLPMCNSDWLEINRNGVIDENILADADGIDGVLIGAYSMLDGVAGPSYGGPSYGWESASSNWLYGDIRGLIANLGGDAGTSSDMLFIQNFNENTEQPYYTQALHVRWNSLYEAISRCNAAINVTRLALEKKSISQNQAELFEKQARALRGWYHFEAWRMWKMIPYVDEVTNEKSLTNTADIRNQIIDDLISGTKLPDDMGQIGRFNGTVSRVLLAKAYMQMFHDYSKALPLLEEVKNNGKKPNGEPIGLAPTYGEIFEIANRNGIESVYTVQYSANDGSRGWNTGWGELLNYPYKFGGSPGGCCGFFQPTQEFVNSFRTINGLPCSGNTYNLDPVKSDQGLSPADPFEPDEGPVDPRLDWSVGRRGIPYWDWGRHTGSDWIRSQSYSGPYSPKKHVYKKSEEGQFSGTISWAAGFSINGYRMIRFADVILLLAECQIETGNLEGGRANINAVRARAANPAGFVMTEDGTAPAALYQVGLYSNPFADVSEARYALQMERKLELGMEGHRWFDLNRWGTAVEELNRVLAYEKTTPWGEFLYGNALVGKEDITYPIPYQVIEEAGGKIVQNR